ncbi:MAG: NACHT domain-containing protein [Defluviitaleaceae bacterium]|nr:NACHT domain-containing protein [Defluviitaleaceae bacterium]
MLKETIFTLIGIPLSIFANFSHNKLHAFVEKNAYLAHGLDDLFLKSFFTSINQHNKHYDTIAKESLNELKRKIKKDKDRFLQLFNGDETIHNLGKENYLRKMAVILSSEYNFDNTDLLFYLILDCLLDYKRCFFAHISNKEFMSIILTELFDCGDSLQEMLNLLVRIDERTAWLDFSSFKDAVFIRHAMTNEHYKKMVDEYDCFIRDHYNDLPLRGFAPSIKGRSLILELEDVFIPIQATKEKPDSQNHSNMVMDDITVSDSLLRHQRCVLLGKPGSGKSTYLKYIAINISKSRHNNTDRLQSVIPIFFKVSEYAKAYEKRGVTLHSFLCNHIEGKFNEFIDFTLRNSNALILIDGLDEVTDKSLRIKVAERIEEFISAYSKVQCIISSRITGYNEVRMGGRFRHYQLDDFTEAQIKHFSIKWFGAVYKERSKEENLKEADELFNSIKQNDSVFKLATNPLLMTIIAMIYFSGRRLPNSRIELYECSTDTFLESWVRTRVDSDSKLKSKEEIIEILCPIAHYIHTEKSDACIGESELFEKFKHYYQIFHTRASEEKVKTETREFIDFLREQAGFFYEVDRSESGENLFSFMHLTFEEYLAGLYIANDFNEGGRQWQDVVYMSRWAEILRLAASHLSRISRKITTNFIEGIMSIQDEFPEVGRKEKLLCQLFSDDITVSDECKQEFMEMSVDYFSSEWSLTTIDQQDYRSLYKSNINNDFWDHCFSKLQTMRDELVCKSILIDVVCDNNVLSLTNVQEKVKQYISTASVPVLKHMIWRMSSKYETSMLKILGKYALEYLPELFYECMHILRILKDNKEDDSYSNLFMARINCLNMESSEFLQMKNRFLLEAASRFGTRSIPNDLLSMLFSDSDNVYVKKCRTLLDKIVRKNSNFHHSSARRISTFVSSGNSHWEVSIYQGHPKKISVIKSDTKDIWIFEYPTIQKNDIDVFYGFPDYIQMVIIQLYFELTEKDDEDKNELFQSWKNLNPALDDVWGLKNYIMSHVNEDAIMDAFFLSIYSTSQVDVNRLTALAKPFAYEPSQPLQLLINLVKKEKITKKLLSDVWEYTLRQSGILRKASFKVLTNIVSKELHKS